MPKQQQHDNGAYLSILTEADTCTVCTNSVYGQTMVLKDKDGKIIKCPGCIDPLRV